MFPYSCEVCKRQVADARNLKTHKMLYAEETPHKCLKCGTFFNLASSLRSHEVSWHSDFKLHACHLCKKGYAQAHLLKKHKFKMHGITSADLPRCDSCRWPDLNAHKFTTHGITGLKNVYVCDICKKVYGHFFDFKRNMCTAHGSRQGIPFFAIFVKKTLR